MILITGATGTVGRLLVTELVARGAPIRAMSRSPDRAGLPAGVPVVPGDMNQPETLPPALEGIDRVFLLSSGSGRSSQEANLVEAARRAGVRRIVKLSALTVADPAVADVITRWHRAGEQLVAESGLEWTVLRPGSFMSNALTWMPMIQRAGKVFASFSEIRTAAIDPRDIAAVAANILISAGHGGRTYDLTGPELISPMDEVSVLSTVLGRELQLIDIPGEAAKGRMLDAGMSSDMADAILTTQANSGRGPGAIVTPAVEDLTGRPARTFADWARAHADRFQ